MKFLLPTITTLEALLAQEDTDGDKKITTEDNGPKEFNVVAEDGTSYTVTGTYHLSNLLQELALAKNQGLSEAEIPLAHIEEAPSKRISRKIRAVFWDDLTRTIDEKGISKIVSDDKTETQVNRIYIPYTDKIAQEYYNNIADAYHLEVVVLPKTITPEYVKSINTKPGILSLKLTDGKGAPFVVPGGRFNEMYGWDSYFEGVGLLLDHRIDLAKGMVDNFCYQIEHYGKILNANRSYYLTRTQPPFLSSFIREVFEANTALGKAWLTYVLGVAITEYETVWMEDGKRLTNNGLNRYFAEGIGIPPETEKGHFEEILKVYAAKHQISVEELEKQYQIGALKDVDLDTYFLHDRSLRESGHDTSWRLDDCCANLTTVDLNSLLYKYETDFSYLIASYFDGSFTAASGKVYTTSQWKRAAEARKQRMNTMLWSDTDGLFYDYDITTASQTKFGSATNFFPLWAKLCSATQAAKLVENLMRDYKVKGGIVATSHKAIAEISAGQVQRQWDYPNGWAPHQMMLWRGLLNYGYTKEAYECIYRWLWMITRNAVDYNGTIPEKYDVVACTHKVYAEYGNVGTQFDYITTSGFGWMNGSYQYGLSLLPDSLIESLDVLKDPDRIF